MVARLFWKYVINGAETFYGILKIVCIVFVSEIFSADVCFFLYSKRRDRFLYKLKRSRKWKNCLGNTLLNFYFLSLSVSKIVNVAANLTCNVWMRKAYFRTCKTRTVYKEIFWSQVDCKLGIFWKINQPILCIILFETG